MKILFTCRANIIRSQIAKALFDKSTKTKSKSAGAKVSEEIQKMKLGELVEAENVISCMNEEGINLCESEIKQITSEMVNWADIVIVMASKKNLPNFVLNSPKAKFWNIKDPKGTNLETHRKTRDQIKSLIKNLGN